VQVHGAGGPGLGGDGVDHGLSLEGVPLIDEGALGDDGVIYYGVAAGGVNSRVAEEHGEGDGLAAHPGVGFVECLADEVTAAKMVGYANLGDAADADVLAGDGDEFVMGGDVGDQFAGGGADKPAMSGGLVNVTAGQEGCFVRKTGEQEVSQVVVFHFGYLGVEAVKDGDIRGARSGRHGRRVGRLQSIGAAIRFGP